MASPSNEKEAEIIEVFISTSRYLDGILNIYKPCFKATVGRIYPPELQIKTTESYRWNNYLNKIHNK